MKQLIHINRQFDKPKSCSISLYSVVFFKKWKIEEALRVTKQYIAIRPNWLEPIKRGIVLLNQGKITEAFKAIITAARMPDQPAAY